LLEVPEGINTNKKIQNIGIYGMWIQAQRDWSDSMIVTKAKYKNRFNGETTQNCGELHCLKMHILRRKYGLEDSVFYMYLTSLNCGFFSQMLINIMINLHTQ
jgi:hypothetical protein